MALQSSGQIKITDIVGEFGGTVPHSLSEYYRNGGEVPGNNTNVPESGTISIGNFYGAVNEIQYTISSGTTNFQTSSAFGSNWTTAVPKRLIVNSGVTVGSSNGNPAMIIDGSMGGTLVVQNAGSVEGTGGAANGGAGGTAVRCDQNGNVTFQNAGALKGGGGGGGAGGAGGAGGQGGTGGAGGDGQYNAFVANYNTQWNFSTGSPRNHSPWNQGGIAHLAEVILWAHWGCRRANAGTFSTGQYQNYGNLNAGQARLHVDCYNHASQSGAAGGSGGSGGTGGAAGAGGQGEGYQQTAQAGASGSAGGAGSSGNAGADNGNNSGQGGTGGTGGQGGTGGTGGAGGSFGNAGATGSAGATGATGITGGTGANGTSSNGATGSTGSGGASGASGSAGGAAGYYIENVHYLTLQNSGTVLGQ